MAFRLEFPTLKQLAMLCLAKRWINSKLLPIDNSFHGTFLSERCLERVHEIVEHTKLPSRFKRELIHVLIGIYCNVTRWKWGVNEDLGNVEIDEYVFDVHGQLDDERTWDKYFGDKLAQVGNKDELLYLLGTAVKESLLPHIDEVLKKLVLLADTGESKTDLEGPRHEIKEDQDVLVYSFRKNLDRQTASNLFLWFHSCKHAYVNCKQIVIHLGRIHLSSLLFRQHFSLLLEHEKMPYFVSNMRVLLARNKMSVVVDILRLLDGKWRRFLKSKYLRVCVLQRFIDRPYDQFFYPTLEYMHNVLQKQDLVMLFCNLVTRIPFQQHHDASYADKLLVFLQRLSPRTKEILLDSTYNPVSYLDRLLIAQIKLLWGKNMTLYHKIIDIIPFRFRPA